MVRADILEDTGSSVNPAIDVGQIEGAFVMSLGLWMTEQLKYNPETGRLLTFDSWVSMVKLFHLYIADQNIYKIIGNNFLKV